MGGMRATVPLTLAILLSGCAGAPSPLGWVAVADMASIAVLHRSMADIVVSLASGRDCSVVRLARGETYCASNDPPPAQPFCTRSLGKVDCWTTPPPAWPPYRTVADGPAGLTPAQEANRTARWPF